VAVGNPPYIGEKTGATMIDATRRRAPYWERFYAVHLDYLYWFVVLGVSKLRRGGRFGFITSAYWLRAAAASPMRRYLAQHCHIERLILFRDVRLFPDAPGHHSLVVVGERRVDAGDQPIDAPAASMDSPAVHVLGAAAARDAPAAPLGRGGRRARGPRGPSAHVLTSVVDGVLSGSAHGVVATARKG
jgi:Eco57I restriction-modification methylase